MGKRKVVSVANRKEAFWAKVDRRGPLDCWLWIGKGNPRHAYGQFYVGWNGERYVEMRAHRVAWMLGNGAPLPDSAHVLHSCDTPRCCNPAHLSLGTKADNMRDAAAKGRHFWQKAIATHRKVEGLFTREDVKLLRDVRVVAQQTIGNEHEVNALASLAARIEALLPPEGV